MQNRELGVGERLRLAGADEREQEEWKRVLRVEVVGDLQVLDPGLYQVDATTLPGEVHRAPGKPLPAMLQHPSALRVRYSAGFGDTAEAVPPNARLWLLAHVAHFVANREATASKLDPLPFVANLIAAWQRVSI